MEPKESLKEYEILDGTPTWAIALFDKVNIFNIVFILYVLNSVSFVDSSKELCHLS